MAIQYAGGTNINTTFSNSGSPTRREIVDGIVAALASAGWSTVSGSGTGDVLMESATTPQGLKCRVRVYDPGSGNTARLYLRSAGITAAAGTFGAGLLPEANKLWRVIANRYQAFVFSPYMVASRAYVGFGSLYIPSTFASQIFECCWMWGSANGDTDTTTRPSFRWTLGSNQNFSTSEMCFILNGNMWEVGNGTNLGGTGSPGNPTLIYPQHANMAYQGYSQYAFRFHDDSPLIAEPLMAFGLNSGDEAKIRGQLWDAIIMTDVMSMGTTFSFDGHNFHNLTHINAGSQNLCARGSLLVVVP